MNLGIENNIEIAQRYCLSPGGCPKLKGKTDYNEKLTICAGCTNYLNKIDLVELLQYYTTNTTTPPTTTNTNTFNGKGKATEQSNTKIRKVITLHRDGKSMTAIQKELDLQFRTVKNIINQSFTNEASNQKVREVIAEMDTPTE